MELVEIFDKELEDKVKQTVEYIKSLLPEGRLRDSIRYIKNDVCDYDIITDTEYAPFVEFGTGIYGSKKKPITPKNAEALRFEIDDQVIFAKSVRGQQGQFFFRAGKEFIKDLLLSGRVIKSSGFAKKYFANKTSSTTKKLLNRLN